MNRIEHDYLGEVSIPEESCWGIQTQRALQNFPFSGMKWNKSFIIAFAYVKEACAKVNTELGYLTPDIGNAIVHVCQQMIAGEYHEQIVVDVYQGGAGTSTNMNFNEVIANLANRYLGHEVGKYDPIHPIHHVNLHQSTNDVFPTAMKVAILFMLKDLESAIGLLQEELQRKEQLFKEVVKLGRTELQDAIPMTLGMEFGAYAEAVARDRWRIYKCRERIKVVNLGGTAIGTGMGAPRDFIFKVTDLLRKNTGLSIARSENLVDATQNWDAVVEVAGMLKAFAVNLLKISNDLRLLSSGPDSGFREIKLPALQAGPTIMPGKVNPVLPEAIGQIALRVMSNDNLIGHAAGLGQLELNQYAPLIAQTMFETLQLLTNGTRAFALNCIAGIQANEAFCKESVNHSKTVATFLLPVYGYETVESFLKEAEKEGVSLSVYLTSKGILTKEQLENLLAPKRMYKLGFTKEDYII